MQNTMIYLIGFAGVGKYTIAKAIAELMAGTLEVCKIVDNHYVLNPIFNLIAEDGITPLPAQVWDAALQVRLAVLATIEHVSPRDWNFVFTNELVEDGLAVDSDGSNLMLYSQIFKVAQARGAHFVPVRLLCDLEEHLSRVVRPERRERMKDVDPNEARDKHANHKLFMPDHANTLTLNVTGLTPEVAARTILDHALECR
jgi:deoxyadenosine/deoxycytidine kinase